MSIISFVKEDKTAKTTIIPAPCSDSIDISKLIQIPTNPTPEIVKCNQNGLNTSLYYIGQLGNQQYDYVVAPWATSPLDVCVKFCKSYVNKICVGESSNGISAQDNFNNCVKQLTDTKCSPPTPIAAIGTTIYYPFTPTRSICDA